MSGKIGDKVGYTLLQDLDGKWRKLDNCDFDTIGPAVALLEALEKNDPGAMFAIGRLALVVISRPEGSRG